MNTRVHIPASRKARHGKQEKVTVEQTYPHVTTTAVVMPPESKEVKFHLDANPLLRDLWIERERRRRQSLENKKWLEEFDAKLAKAMGDKEELYLNGARVAVYINNGTFKKNLFLSEQPKVAEACLQWKQVLDLDVLKSKYPDVYRLYRARAMNVKDEPVTPD